MKAEDTLITNLLQGAKQFIVPIFQRDYSWGTKHCDVSPELSSARH